MEKLVLNKELENIGEVEKHMALLLYALSGMRVLRILYLANTFVGLKMVVLCLRSSLGDLAMMGCSVFSFVLLNGTLGYFGEALSNLRTFQTLLEAMWWSLITMTTVGYGDVQVTSVAGKLAGAICALSGVIVLALPINVLANNFTKINVDYRAYQQKISKRGFLVKNPKFSRNPHLIDPDQLLTPTVDASSTSAD
ncbi:hypothetical protein ACOMHN_022225 [Nucella lapillus]